MFRQTTSRAALAVLLIATPAVAQTDGAFTLRESRHDDRLNLHLQYQDGRSNWGRDFARSEFSDVNRNGDRITFAMRRAAGSFAFEGRGSLERASGWYVFTPNADFRRQLERIGFRDIDDRAMFTFAMDGMTVADVKRLQGLVADTLDTAQVVRLINHGAGVTYIQAMSDLGFRKLESGEYRRARDHGVSVDYVRGMAALGMKLPLDGLIRSRDHGVDPEYVRAMQAAGHTLTHEELVRARDHGVNPEFIKRMGALGYDGLSLGEYVRLRDHGVNPEYVEALRDAGLAKLSATELVRLRDHGVSASYVKRMRDLFKEPPTAEQLIRLRSRGDPGR